MCGSGNPCGCRWSMIGARRTIGKLCLPLPPVVCSGVVRRCLSWCAPALASLGMPLRQAQGRLLRAHYQPYALTGTLRTAHYERSIELCCVGGGFGAQWPARSGGVRGNALRPRCERRTVRDGVVAGPQRNAKDWRARWQKRQRGTSLWKRRPNARTSRSRSKGARTSRTWRGSTQSAPRAARAAISARSVPARWSGSSTRWSSAPRSARCKARCGRSSATT